MQCGKVAPRVGAWIEILSLLVQTDIRMSLPVWERGLKLPLRYKVFVL